MAAIFLALIIIYCLNTKSVTNQIDSYKIDKGQSVAKVALELHDLQVLENELITIFLLKFFNLAGKIKAGVYEFNVGESRWDVLKKITRGEQKSLEITFVEGSTYKQIQKELESSKYLKIDNCDIALIKKYFNFKINSIEGLFFPDTYFYNANTYSSAILILASKKAQKNAKKNITSDAINNSIPIRNPS